MPNVANKDFFIMIILLVSVREFSLLAVTLIVYHELPIRTRIIKWVNFKYIMLIVKIDFIPVKWYN